MQILQRSMQGFWKDRCFLYSSSLTFYTLMAIVPLFAIAFALAKALGIHENLKIILLERFHGQREVFVEITQFAQKLLEEAHGGGLAILGVSFLFWSIGSLFKNMEDAFNQIWKVKLRNWKRILAEYSILVFLGPLFFILSSSTAVFLTSQTLSYAIFWVLFTLIFFFTPNTRVHFFSAVIAGVWTAILYLIAQAGYLYFQRSVSRYGAVYGSFAALPLFLIWLQLSWSIILLGGEITCAHQTVKEEN